MLTLKLAALALLASSTAALKVEKPVVKPVLKLRGGVSAGDVITGGALFLSASVGLPALAGGSDALFMINYPGFDWAGYQAKWTAESKSYLDTMTRFFGGALLLAGALQYYAKDVMAAKPYYAILTVTQLVFAGLQIFFAAPTAAMPSVHYVYAGMNAVLAVAGAMAMI
mmetsp:Transcript_44207/g.142065  ORF Transcript_44207/g.142065 Transcript_44207/m.142065 type:complete len:169 (+) Transcript_44207:56-562(+)